MIMKNQTINPFFKIKSLFDSIGFSLYFSMLIAIALIFGSIKQYNDNDLTSYASIVAFAMALLIPFFIILFTSRFFVYDDRIFAIVKLLGNAFFVISGYIFIVDFLNFLSLTMVEAPPIMQLGYYWVYRFQSLVLYISSLFVQLLLSGLDRMKNHYRKTIPMSIYDISGNSIILILLSFIFLIIFPRFGMFGMIITQLIIGSFHLFFNCKIFIDSRRTPRNSPRNKTENYNSQQYKSIFVNGFINFFKSIFLSIPFFGIIVVNLY